MLKQKNKNFRFLCLIIVAVVFFSSFSVNSMAAEQIENQKLSSFIGEAYPDFYELAKYDAEAAEWLNYLNTGFLEDMEQAHQEALEIALSMPVVPDWKDVDARASSNISRNSTIPPNIPRRAGIIYVASRYDLKGIAGFQGHASITFSLSRIVESMPAVLGFGDGVIIVDDNFWVRPEQTSGTMWAVTTLTTTMDEDRQAALWAFNKIGSSYLNPIPVPIFNPNPTSRRDVFYCSHLIWAAFLDQLGLSIVSVPFTGIITPVSLVNPSTVAVIHTQ